MLVTNHVLSGALIGAASRGPVGAFTAGVASHFVLDFVPHWGDVTWEEMLPVARRDGIAGLVAMGLLTLRTPPEHRFTVLAGMAGAAFPDLDKPCLHFFGRSPFPTRVDDFHVAVQHEARHRMPQEIAVGATLLGIALAVIRRDRNRPTS